MRTLILANKLLELSLVKGFFKVIADFQDVILKADAAVVTVLIIWQFFVMQHKVASASDEGVDTAIKGNKKVIKITLIAGIGIALATEILPVLYSYFTEG